MKDIKKLKDAFPQLPATYYDVLLERIKEKEFSNKQLRDSINNLIDNYVYPTPALANILSWDKRIKLYTYSQIIAMVNVSGVIIWDEFKAIKNSPRMYASISDIETYKLTIV